MMPPNQTPAPNTPQPESDSPPPTGNQPGAVISPQTTGASQPQNTQPQTAQPTLTIPSPAPPQPAPSAAQPTPQQPVSSAQQPIPDGQPKPAAQQAKTPTVQTPAPGAPQVQQPLPPSQPTQPQQPTMPQNLATGGVGLPRNKSALIKKIVVIAAIVLGVAGLTFGGYLLFNKFFGGMPLSTYENQEFGASLKYPEGWPVEEDLDSGFGTEATVTITEPEERGGTADSVIQAIKYSLDKSEEEFFSELESYSKDASAAVGEQSDTLEFDIEGPVELTISGHKAHRYNLTVTGSGEDEDESGKGAIVAVYVDAGTQFVISAYAMDEDKDLQDTLEKIVSSVNIL